jgi:hypothetical protein
MKAACKSKKSTAIDKKLRTRKMAEYTAFRLTSILIAEAIATRDIPMKSARSTVIILLERASPD